MSKISVLVASTDFLHAYSVAGVCISHITYLEKYGLLDKVLIPSNFKEDLTQYSFKDKCYFYTTQETEGEPDFIRSEIVALEVQKIIKSGKLLTHDVVFIDCYKFIRDGLIAAAEENDSITFYNYIHSIPLDRSDIHGFKQDNWNYIVPSEAVRKYVKKAYGTTLDKVFVVPHFIDAIEESSLTKELKEDLHRLNYHDKDLVFIYPVRLSVGKKVPLLLDIIYLIKNHFHKNVLLILPLAFPENQREHYEKILSLIKDKGLENEVFLSSDSYADQNRCTLRNDVKELYRLSDIYLQTSYAESFCLNVLEAGISNCLTVLNDSIEVNPQFLGKRISDGSYTNSLAITLDSIETSISYEKGIEEYLKITINRILREVKTNKLLQNTVNIRKHYNPKYVFENYMSSILKP